MLSICGFLLFSIFSLFLFHFLVFLNFFLFEFHLLFEMVLIDLGFRIIRMNLLRVKIKFLGFMKINQFVEKFKKVRFTHFILIIESFFFIFYLILQLSHHDIRSEVSCRQPCDKCSSSKILIERWIFVWTDTLFLRRRDPNLINRDILNFHLRSWRTSWILVSWQKSIKRH